MFTFRKNPNANSQLLRRPNTAIVVSSRIEQISKPIYRENRLDRFGFDHPDLHNIVIPKTIAQLSEYYEAVNNQDQNDSISVSKSKNTRFQKTSANTEKLGNWVQTELFNFEERLKTQTVTN